MPSVTTYAVSTVPMVEEFPAPITDVIENAILVGTDIVEDILTELEGGFSLEVDDFVKYGEDHFTHGLPKAVLSKHSASVPASVDALKKIEGKSAVVQLASFGQTEADFVAYEYLAKNQDYDHTTGIVGSPDFSTSGTVTIASADFTFDVGEIQVTFEDSSNPGNGPISVYPFPGASILANGYTHVYYLKSDPAKKPKFWTYYPDQNDYPQLPVPAVTVIKNRYMPIAKIRSNKEFIIPASYGEKDPLPKGGLIGTTNKLLKKINVDLQDLVNDLNTNKDIDDIQSAMVMMAADVTSKRQSTINYLHEYFRALNARAGVSSDSWGSYNEDGSVDQNSRGAYRPKIKVRLNDPQLKADLTIDYIDSTITEGVIGSLEYCTSEIVLNASSGGYDGLQNVSGDYIAIRKQITAGAYRTVIARGILWDQNIYGDHSIAIDLEGASDPNQGGLHIPLDSDLVRKFTRRQQLIDDLYYDSLKLVLHARVKTKLEWYETKEFAILIQIVAVVLTVISLGSLTTFTAVLVQLAINVAISIAVEFLIELVGTKVGFLLAVIALAVYGSNKILELGMAFADSLLMVANSVISATGKVNKNEIKDILKDQKQIDEEYAERLEEIETAQSLLNDAGELDPLYVLKTYKWIPEEGSEAFYARCLNPNPGLLGFDILHSWNDAAVQLPQGLDITNKYV